MRSLRLFGAFALLSLGQLPLLAQDSAAQTREPRSSFAQQELGTVTDQWAVILEPGTDPAALAAQLGFVYVGPVGELPNTYLFERPGSQVAREATDAAQTLQSAPAVEFFEQQVAVQLYPRQVENPDIAPAEDVSVRAPTDPLYPNQWHLRNTGQSGGTAGVDVNVLPVWNAGYTGSGVVISVVDDGLQWTHPDISANYNPALSYDFNEGNADPSPGAGDNHGTAAAGVAAARDNTTCGVGAAYRASIAGVRLIAGPTTDATNASALNYGLSSVSIYSNSWGPNDNGSTLGGAGTLTANALANGVQNGRSGRGAIYVWAAGNGRTASDNVNADTYANSRYVIAVGAVDHNGVVSYYSEPGAPMLITAPSNGNTVGITTTDLLGTAGYSTTDCTSTFGGTSSSAPLVAGVIADLLQVNPLLGWRDVQHLLVRTAVKNDPSNSDWTTNGAGLNVNHNYGFGRVNAGAAAYRASRWINVPPEIGIPSVSATVNQAIPDGTGTWVTSNVNVNVSGTYNNFYTEHVEVTFNATHTYRGDLEIQLISPSGTISQLMTKRPDGGDNYQNYTFSSVRHWGENPNGTWQLRVRDVESPDGGTFNNWTLRIYGFNHPAVPTAAPTLLSPANGANTTLTPTLQWSSVSNAQAYNIQVDDNADFSSPLVDTFTYSTSYTFSSAIPAGIYYWRVSGRALNQYGPWSSTFSFIAGNQAPPNTNLIRNGDFSSNFTYWASWDAVTYRVNAGVLEMYRNVGGESAVVLQDTQTTAPANAPFSLQISLGNSSAVRKRAVILIHDLDFSDLQVCNFWIPPNTPLRTYSMQTRSREEWQATTLSIYVSPDDGTGWLRVDNANLQYQPALSINSTRCTDPGAPAPGSGSNSANMITNGSFGSGMASWLTYGQIVSQVNSGVFEFYRPAGNPAGVVLQPTGLAVPANMPLEAQFQLGNSSGVLKRVTVIVHDLDFTDLQVCTFWLPPGSPLQNYTLRTHTTRAWTNATFSVYGATVGNQQWIRLDNVTMVTRPTLNVVGTECYEPGAVIVNALAVVDSALPETTELPDTGLTRIESDDAIVVGSGWQAQTQPEGASGASYLINTSPDAALTLRFSGDSASVVYVAGPSFGSFGISVDGTLIQTVTASADEYGFESIVTVSDLPLSEHELSIVPQEGVVAIDAFEVAQALPPAATPEPGETVTPGEVTLPPTETVEVTPEPGVPTGTQVPTETQVPAETPTATPTPLPLILPVAAGMDDGAQDWVGTDAWSLQPQGGFVGAGWQASGDVTGASILLWDRQLDLRGVFAGQQVVLAFASSLTSARSTATVEVTTDDTNWQPVAVVAPSIGWTQQNVDLTTFAGQLIRLRFVWNAVAPQAEGEPTDSWALDEVSVQAVLPTPTPTFTLEPTATFLPTATLEPTATPEPTLTAEPALPEPPISTEAVEPISNP